MKKAALMLIVCVLCMTMSLPARAYSYDFAGPTTAFGSATDTDEPVPFDPASANVRRDKDAAATPPPYFYGSGIIPTESVASLGVSPPLYSGSYESPTAIDMPTYFADGSVGILSIPPLGIYMKAFEGATDESMSKGVAHFSDTAAWNGNVGLCGHNRGGNYNIGAIKSLRAGDTITYTTTLGSRTYKVVFVGTIAATDWSYLSPTADTRITLITCLEDQPDLRVCVQAVEV